MINNRNLRPWKYQLKETYSVITDIRPPKGNIYSEYIYLGVEDKVSNRGTLIIKKGYFQKSIWPMKLLRKLP